MPKDSNIIALVFEQRSEGDETVEGNKTLHTSTSFRSAQNFIRIEAQKLRDKGCETKLIPELKGTGKAYGYTVTEPPAAEGQLGVQWNLLLITRPKPPEEPKVAAVPAVSTGVNTVSPAIGGIHAIPRQA